jgi:hypothetical protein
LQFILRGSSFKHGPTLDNAVTTVFGKKALAALQGTSFICESSFNH